MEQTAVLPLERAVGKCSVGKYTFFLVRVMQNIHTHTYINTYIHIHTHTHTYIHTHIYTYREREIIQNFDC